MPFRKRGWLRWRRRYENSLDPDEVLLDASNFPGFNTSQFEGRLELPISRRTGWTVVIVICLIVTAFSWRLFLLQVKAGPVYAERAENNTLRHTTIFAERGIIKDRNGVPLAWNESNPDNPDFAKRVYTDIPGLSHLLGYVKYPSKDTSGAYYSEAYEPKDGLELFADEKITGHNGVKIEETNAKGETVSQNVVEAPRAGETLTLSIDSELTSELYKAMQALSAKIGFTGAAGALMDLRTGEIIALTSFPEYDSNVFTEGKDTKGINATLANKQNPFLNRFTDGLYTPGSIVKPFLGVGALNEGLITPQDKILSTGSISVPNPYDPTKKSVFVDWKAHGWVDLKRAIAVSSNVYFYEVGGGFEDQKGLGIGRIEKYLRLFGLGEPLSDTETGGYLSGVEGVIPNPEWKAKVFNGEAWRLGDTYHTAIGQYGVQFTPIQMLRAVATIADDGVMPHLTLLKKAVASSTDARLHDSNNEPPVVASKTAEKVLDIPIEHFRSVKEGMRLGVLEGIAVALNIPGVHFAAKTGTAEIDAAKKYVNSWVIGFMPYESPRYAFTMVMERGPYSNTIGASSVARTFFEWMTVNKWQMFQ